MEFASSMQTPVGKLTVLANDTHITTVSFDINSSQPSNHITSLAIQQLTEYFSGQRQVFDLPLFASGTAFQQAVWQELLTIEYGKTASYLDIATSLNKPTACRAVGAANGKNPIGIIVPCHRIIGANGTLTGYAGGLDRKAFLLSLEKQHALEQQYANS